MGAMRHWLFLLALAAKARGIIDHTISASGHTVEVGTPNLSGTVARMGNGVKRMTTPSAPRKVILWQAFISVAALAIDAHCERATQVGLRPLAARHYPESGVRSGS
jgi:hypothetical protein